MPTRVSGSALRQVEAAAIVYGAELDSWQAQGDLTSDTVEGYKAAVRLFIRWLKDEYTPRRTT